MMNSKTDATAAKSSKANVAHRTETAAAAQPLISYETDLAMRQAFYAQFGRNDNTARADVPADAWQANDLRAALAVEKGQDTPPFELLAAALLLHDLASNGNAFADELSNGKPAAMVGSIRAALRVALASVAELENILAARIAFEKDWAAARCAEWDGVE